jgi:hypothetical protein
MRCYISASLIDNIVDLYIVNVYTITVCSRAKDMTTLELSATTLHDHVVHQLRKKIRWGLVGVGVTRYKLESYGSGGCRSS